MAQIDISIKDNTASSLVWYKYSAQYANTAGANYPGFLFPHHYAEF